MRQCRSAHKASCIRSADAMLQIDPRSSIVRLEGWGTVIGRHAACCVEAEPAKQLWPTNPMSLCESPRCMPRGISCMRQAAGCGLRPWIFSRGQGHAATDVQLGTKGAAVRERSTQECMQRTRNPRRDKMHTYLMHGCTSEQRLATRGACLLCDGRCDGVPNQFVGIKDMPSHRSLRYPKVVPSTSADDVNLADAQDFPLQQNRNHMWIPPW